MTIAVPTICRDCRMISGEARARCFRCRSPRLFTHPEWEKLAIAHVDCDAFYATIEKRDDPSLAARPVIVGGGRRGVVSTACYIARIHGVRSAMPMFKALAVCPNAVVIKPNMEKYAKVSREVRRLMLELTPLVEPVSIDEAFLDLSGTQALHKTAPAITLMSFADRVEREIGVTVSIGLSFNKFLAKIASDLDKPRGFSAIGEKEAQDFLMSKPVTILPGVGKAAAARFAKAGVTTVADLRALEPRRLFSLLGSDSARLLRLANARDERRVTPEHETKSVSAETTFDTDTRDPQVLLPILMHLSEKVSSRMKAKNLGGSTVTLKLKTSDFRLVTRARSTSSPTNLAGRIYQTARSLIEPELSSGPYRLIGVGMSELVPGQDADRGDLADQSVRREAGMERAVDELRARFGQDAITRGLVFGARAPAEKPRRS
ncbi:MAG: DNA polymerase IV [Hyphomicrobiales bacterium]|nr:DNA polymerase IV [Hyphomicrobiales bacterium]MBV9434061.1 DNA polymerase IV [Hyphomicrobiales bacterium]